jgi:putative heme-binding domain-containing protein
VRFRVALALGGLKSNDAVAPLATITLKQPDEWIRQAVASALPEHIAPVLIAVLPATTIDPMLTHELAKLIGSRQDPAEVGRLLDMLCQPIKSNLQEAHENALLGLVEGLARRGSGISELVGQLPNRDALRKDLDVIFTRAAHQAGDEQLDEIVRTRNIDLLKYSRVPRASEVLLRIVSRSDSQALRIRAASALAAHAGADIGPALLASYPTQTPVVRRAILDALVTEPARAQLLLDAVETGQITRAELQTTREDRLRQHADGAVKSRASKLLVSEPPAERKQVLADYRIAMTLKSDPRLGKKLFRKHCSTCHHIGDVGVDVAPDISDSRVKTPEQLLNDILNPNAAIDNNYVSYTVAMQDGSVLIGVIAAETTNSITLKQPENKTLSLLRADIESLRSNGVSLMPEGFEKNLSQQEIADVISFIKNWRYLDQPIPGTLAPAR